MGSVSSVQGVTGNGTRRRVQRWGEDPDHAASDSRAHGARLDAANRRTFGRMKTLVSMKGLVRWTRKYRGNSSSRNLCGWARVREGLLITHLAEVAEKSPSDPGHDDAEPGVAGGVSHEATSMTMRRELELLVKHHRTCRYRRKMSGVPDLPLRPTSSKDMIAVDGSYSFLLNLSSWGSPSSRSVSCGTRSTPRLPTKGLATRAAHGRCLDLRTGVCRDRTSGTARCSSSQRSGGKNSRGTCQSIAADRRADRDQLPDDLEGCIVAVDGTLSEFPNSSP